MDVSATPLQPLIIGEQRLATDQVVKVRSPWDDALVGRCCVADEAEARQALAVAGAAFHQARRQPVHERVEVLRRTAALIRAQRDELAAGIVAEAGKPLTLAEAEAERCALTFEFAAAELLTGGDAGIPLAASAAGAGHEGFSRRFPLGVILAVTPFNFPLNLVAHKLAPAVATGNAVLLKPSPRTPFSAHRLTELLLEAGMIPGQVCCALFDPALIPVLLNDPALRMVSFTGSAAVGWKLKAQAARQKVTLELGGNAAAVVCADADWRAAIPGLAAGAFGYAGQSCISLQRLLVERSIHDEFKAAWLQHIRENIRHGDPRDRAVLVGPLIDRAARDRVLAWVDEALKAGAKLLTDLRPSLADPVLPPIVVEGVPAHVKLGCEEVFGPVVTLQAFEDFDDALFRVNASPFGLQAGVYTNDARRAWRAFREIEAGAVLINQGPTFRTENMPYGGVKDSGFGREGLRRAMEDMTEERLLVWKTE